jgi:hypothetical protein
MLELNNSFVFAFGKGPLHHLVQRNYTCFVMSKILFIHLQPFRRDGRVVEGARLESVYTSKGYPGFESQSLRKPAKRPTGRFYFL